MWRARKTQALAHLSKVRQSQRSISTTPTACEKVMAIRREDINVWERRAPISPAHVKDLVDNGIRVLVQPSTRRAYTMAEYEDAGAVISEDLSAASLIVGVKAAPINQLLSDKTYAFFSHTIKAQPGNMPLLDSMLDKNIRLIDYERMLDSKGQRVAAFGKFAGVAGMINILHGLGLRLLALGHHTPFMYMGGTHNYKNSRAAKLAIFELGEDISMGKLPAHFGPLSFVFTGSGNVSQGAQEMFQELPHMYVPPHELKHAIEKGDHRKLIGTVVRREDYLVPKAGGKFNAEEYDAHPEKYRSIFAEKIAPYMSVMVNGVYWQPGFPRLLTNEDIQHLTKQKTSFSLSDGCPPLPHRFLAVCDISADLNGSLEFMRECTTIEYPFELFDPQKNKSEIGMAGNGLLICSIDNLPAQLPREATDYFGKLLLPWIPEMVASDVNSPFENQTHFSDTVRNAVIASNGKLTPNYEYIDDLRKGQEPVQPVIASVKNPTTAPIGTKDIDIKHKVLLLGSGLVAGPVVDYLMRDQTIRLTIASMEAEEAAALSEVYANASSVSINVHDEQDRLNTLVGDHELVISLLPFNFHPKVARMCIQHKVDLVTASYASPAMKELHQSAVDAGITILNEVGLDPGIDHMTAMECFDEVKDHGGKTSLKIMSLAARNLLRTSRQNDPEYLNWLAFGEAFRLLSNGIRKYVEDKMKELHALITTKIGGPGIQCICKGTTTRKHRNPHSNRTTTCIWAQTLKTFHTNPDHIPWHQSMSGRWHDPTLGYWEIAKLFMSVKIMDPSTTDGGHLLNLLKFCNHFKIQLALVGAVKFWRNEWAHKWDHKLGDLDKQNAFKDIENLINDPELMKSKDVQDCRVAIKSVETADFMILQENELQILQEFRHIHECHQEHKMKERFEDAVGKLEKVMDKMRFVFPITVVCFAVLMLVTFPGWYKVLGLFMFGERNVISDDGCPNAITESPIDHFHFREFYFSSHLAEKREGFVGRKWFFLELESILNESRGTAGVLITGDPGSGKSTLVSQLICSPSSSWQIHNNTIGYHLCDYSEKGKRDGARFVRNLVDQIAARLPEYSKHVINDEQIRTQLDTLCHKDPTACFFTTVVGPLNKLKQPDGFRFIIIDALDECFERDTSEIMEILNSKIRQFPKWLKVILTSRNSTSVTSRLPRVVKRMPLYAMDGRNLKDIRSYVSRFLFQNSDFSRAAGMEMFLDEVITHTEGNFLFVKTILQYMNDTDRKVDFHSLPTRLFDLYDNFFDRQFGKDGFGPFGSIFEVLSSFSPLQAQDLPEIIKSGYETADSSKLIKQVSCFLRFGRDGTVRIYHQSFAEWLIDQTPVLGINKTRGHQSIAKFLLQRMIRIREKHVDVNFEEVTELFVHTLFGGSLEMQETAMDRLNITEMRDPQNNQSILHYLVTKPNLYLLLFNMFSRKFQTIDIVDAEGDTPLHFAARYGLEDVVGNSVRLGADVHIKNKKGETPLFTALDSFSVYRYFKNHYRRCYTTNDGLFVSCSTSQYDKIVKDLIWAQKPSISKCDAQSAHMLNLVIEKRMPLSLYALLKVGVDIDCQENESISPLLQHILVGGRQVGEFLKIFEVDVFVKCGVPFISSELHLISYVTVSSDFGNFFKPSLNKKRFPFQRLIDHHPRGVRILDECYDAEGYLPIHRAAQGGNLPAIQWFKSVGVNTKLKTRSGFTALDISVLNLGNKNYGNLYIESPRIYLLNMVDLAWWPEFRYPRVPVTLSKYRNVLFEELLQEVIPMIPKSSLEFSCGLASEGLSLLHIAAVKGTNVLRYVHKKASEIFPSLPISCVNKHQLDPVYLARFYDSVQNEGLIVKSKYSGGKYMYYSDHVLFKGNDALFDLQDEMENEIKTDQNIIDKEFGHESVPDAICPDREVEYILVSIYLYHPPLSKSTRNDLRFDEEIPISDCPGYYDNLAKLEKAVPLEAISIDECSKEIRVRHDHYMKLCMQERKKIHVYTHNCPQARSDLQWRLAWNRRRNRQLSSFIATRMGWSVGTQVHDIYKLWPFYFAHKTYLEEYEAYDYLKILNEALEISDTRFVSKDSFAAHMDP